MKNVFIISPLVLLASLIVCALGDDFGKAMFDALTYGSKQHGHVIPYYPPVIATDGPPKQKPCVWQALKDLKGKKSNKDSYPYLTEIPESSFKCEQVHQAGFYADINADCQVIRRCDPDGGLSSYLCPIGTIFNQITLICDWWYNVDCSRSAKYRDYSNVRLYHPHWPLLDDCNDHSEYGESEDSYQTTKNQAHITKKYTTKPTTHKEYKTKSTKRYLG